MSYQLPDTPPATQPATPTTIITSRYVPEILGKNSGGSEIEDQDAAHDEN